MIDEFADPELGGFFYTGRNHEALIVRQKDPYDNATPSGNAMAATALLRLATLTGRDDLTERGRAALQSVLVVLQRAPAAAGQSLMALDFLLATAIEFAVFSGRERGRSEMEAIYARFMPAKVVAQGPSADAARLTPLLADRGAIDGQTTTYICERFACQAPLIGVESLRSAIAARLPRV